MREKKEEGERGNIGSYNLAGQGISCLLSDNNHLKLAQTQFFWPDTSGMTDNILIVFVTKILSLQDVL